MSAPHESSAELEAAFAALRGEVARELAAADAAGDQARAQGDALAGEVRRLRSALATIAGMATCQRPAGTPPCPARAIVLVDRSWRACAAHAPPAGSSGTIDPLPWADAAREALA